MKWNKRYKKNLYHKHFPLDKEEVKSPFPPKTGIIKTKAATHLTIFGYSLSFPLLSFHLLYITLASTFAGLNVLGSFNSEITDSNIVLTFCVGFHLSHGNSPDCGSSIGGCKMLMHKSPFCNN